MAKKFPTNQSFQRLNNMPLDETVVFDNLAQAQNYANNNPTAYRGQVVHVKDARTPSEIDEGVFIYEETCYIDLLKNVKPICSFTYEAMGMFFDLMYEIINNPTEETRAKVDTLKEIMYDNYAYDFNEIPTGDYYTQPWHPANYNEYQICLKMTSRECSDNDIGSGYFSARGAGYRTEDIRFRDDNYNDYYYKVITFNNGQLPTKISFKNGDCIEKVIHMCDTSKLTDMKEMFYNCKALITIEDANKWNISNVTDMQWMFNGCTALASLDLSGWDTSNVTNMIHMFDNCTALTTIGDVSTWDTSNITDMYAMFLNCQSLTSLNINNWNIENVIDITSMFENCKALTTLDLSDWNTSKIGTKNDLYGDQSFLVSGIFSGCESLVSLNLSNWDLSNIKTLRYAFQNCKSLTNLDISNWNAPNLYRLEKTFLGCSSLIDLDLSVLSKDNALYLGYTFSECSSLKNLIGIENWIVFDTSRTFSGCSSIEELDLTSWETSTLVDISEMFKNCSSLQSINLSGWNTEAILRLTRIFAGCTSLEYLDVSGWKFNNRIDYNNAEGFDSCDALEWENINTTGCDDRTISILNTIYQASI